MDARSNNAVDLTQTNVCRCCLSAGCFKNISTEYYFSGQKEVYGDMLKTTFDIQISHQVVESVTHLICEDCITRIRDATLFKQMVLQNEQYYLQIVETLKTGHETDTKLIEDEVKLEHIKCESPNVMDFGDESYDDDEILANIKIELQNDGILNTRKRKHYVHDRQTRLKKCNIKTDIDRVDGAFVFHARLKEMSATGGASQGRCLPGLRVVRKRYRGPGMQRAQEGTWGIQSQKDWSKIAERRGNGPILRENSLKLLANSTIFVFQWNKSRYRCFCCKEPFSDINLLRQHTNTKHTLKAIEKKIIDQQNRLVKVDISVLKCKICDEPVQNLSTLREHLIDSHNFQFQLKEDLLVPFKIGGDLSCQLCTESFTVFRLLNIHMNKHFQKQVCHICGAGFSNLVFLNLHKSRSHKPLKCRQCDLTFNSKIDKRNHEISIHNIKFERKLRFPCPYCNERFFQENFRVQHLVEKHGAQKPEFKCNICSKTFITKSLCNNHLKSVHLKEKCHECDICHNFFYTKSDVSRHKVTHTGEKNFSCTLCNNPFASKDSLRRHMKRTHGVL